MPRECISRSRLAINFFTAICENYMNMEVELE